MIARRHNRCFHGGHLSSCCRVNELLIFFKHLVDISKWIRLVWHHVKEFLKVIVNNVEVLSKIILAILDDSFVFLNFCENFVDVDIRFLFLRVGLLQIYQVSEVWDNLSFVVVLDWVTFLADIFSPVIKDCVFHFFKKLLLVHCSLTHLIVAQNGFKHLSSLFFFIRDATLRKVSLLRSCTALDQRHVKWAGLFETIRRHCIEHDKAKGGQTKFINPAMKADKRDLLGNRHRDFFNSRRFWLAFVCCIWQAQAGLSSVVVQNDVTDSLDVG